MGGAPGGQMGKGGPMMQDGMAMGPGKGGGKGVLGSGMKGGGNMGMMGGGVFKMSCHMLVLLRV